MKIKVTKNEVKINKKTILNDGEYKINRCEFEFTSEYDGLVKKAVFFNDFDEPYKVTITNDTCDIPIEVLKKGKMTIGVYAYETNNDELVLRYSPSPDIIHVFDGSYVKDAQNSSTPTPTEIEQIEQQLQSKQDKLISSENIKTLNGNSILGHGDLSLAGAGDMEKRIYDTNDNGIVDNAEKVNNHTVECDVPANAVFTDTVFSGDYNDLSNKPSIPSKTSDLTNDSGYISSYTETDPTVPSHVKSISQGDIANWNNKSTFSGNYEDLTNKPTIPTVPTNVSSFTNDAGYLTSHQDISGKQDIIQYSIMPTASISNLGDIIQYTGTTNSTYTNGYFYKCVSDGQEPATYSWEEVEVQASSGGSSYTAGTNIEITNENVINNTIPYSKGGTEQYPGRLVGSLKSDGNIGNNSVGFGNEIDTKGINSIVLGNHAQGQLENCIAIGSYANAIGNQCMAIGESSRSNNAGMAIGKQASAMQKSIAFGWMATTTKAGQVMFGGPLMPISEIAIYDNGVTKIMATQEFVQNYLTTVSGYDSTKTQVLKNVNGTMTWVDE